MSVQLREKTFPHNIDKAAEVVNAPDCKFIKRKPRTIVTENATPVIIPGLNFALCDIRPSSNATISAKITAQKSGSILTNFI